MREKALPLRRKAIFVGVLLLFAGFVLMTVSASARSPIWRPRPPQASFSVTLQGDGGERLRTFQHGGQTFVLGESGDRYAIRIHNPTARRVEAVVSVDGRDAISGDSADFVSHRGYVIPAFGSVTVDGFRTSLDRVAAFRFTDPENSYSARRGTPQNVGVIGVAFFSERQREAPQIARRGRAKSAPGKRSASPSAAAPADERSASRRDEASRLGTEFGESRMSSVTEVAFERESRTRPDRVIALRYDDATGLQARGIQVFGERPWRPASTGPDPFPRARFAQPPRD
jgi:hypothetical protein